MKKFDLASKYTNQPIEISYDVDPSFRLPLAGEAEGTGFLSSITSKIRSFKPHLFILVTYQDVKFTSTV